LTHEKFAYIFDHSSQAQASYLTRALLNSVTAAFSCTVSGPLLQQALFQMHRATHLSRSVVSYAHVAIGFALLYFKSLAT